jgi:DNA replication protein DnaC
MKFLKKPEHMLVFCGAKGLGKTRFCAALTDWSFLMFNTRRYHREKDLLKKLREGISEGFGDYITNLEIMVDDEFVILDDVGSGINVGKHTNRDLEFRREVLYAFLDYRYNSMLPTVITTNFNQEEFLEVFDERSESRLFASENTIIQMFGEGLDKRKEGL